MPVLRALALEHRRELFQVVVGVDGAHGVVGRVDDHDGGFLVDGGLHRGDVDLEVVRACGNLDQLAARIVRPRLVLHEVRRDGDDLLSWADECLEGDGDGRRRTRREVQVLAGVVGAKAAVEVVGDDVADLDEAGARRVAVLVALAFCHEARDGGVDALGRRHRRIADGQVEDLVLANLGFTLEAVGKRLANLVGGGTECAQFFVDHMAWTTLHMRTDRYVTQFTHLASGPSARRRFQLMKSGHLSDRWRGGTAGGRRDNTGVQSLAEAHGQRMAGC